MLFDEQVRKVVPAQSNARAPAQHHPRARRRREPARGTGIARALDEVGEAVRRRGLVILFSDLMDDSDEILRGLKQVRHRGHEVLLFHVLAHDEVTFPFERLTRFEGMEDLRRLTRRSRRAAHGLPRGGQGASDARLRRVCLANRIDLVELDTAESLGVVLAGLPGQARRTEAPMSLAVSPRRPARRLLNPAPARAGRGPGRGADPHPPAQPAARAARARGRPCSGCSPP